MQIHRQENGFGMLGIAMVIAFVLLIGIVIITAYQSSHKQNAATPHQNTGNTSPSQPSNQPDSNAQPTDKYMDIKELGVKIKLNSATQDDTYRYSAPITSGDNALIFNPAMQKVDAGNPNCNVNAGYIGMIQRSKDPTYFSHGSERVMVDNVTSFKIGDYYYVFAPSDSECSQDAMVAQQRAGFAQDFRDVFRSIHQD
jgi:hypothetical protein